MTRNKTKAMFDYNVLKMIIKIENEELEDVQECIYFGQMIIFKKDHENEIQ